MKKIISLVFSLATFLFVLPKTALAVCPVCTVAVVAGLGLSRWLGIDDSVSGLWIGGVILSSSFWFSDWLGKKGWLKFKYKNLAIAIATYLLVFIPLWKMGITGHPFNVLFGIDKLVFGGAVGSILFLAALWADKKVREISGHQLFSFQRVVFPVSTLVIASLILYFVTRR